MQNGTVKVQREESQYQHLYRSLTNSVHPTSSTHIETKSTITSTLHNIQKLIQECVEKAETVNKNVEHKYQCFLEAK